MKYPMRSNYLHYQRADDGLVRVTDYITGEAWELPLAWARFLRKLDGRTDPFQIAPEVRPETVEEVLDWFEEEGLLRTCGRILFAGIGSAYWALYFPQVRRKHRVFGRIFNRVLLLTFLPMLFLGVRTCLRPDLFLDGQSGFAAGCLLGLLFGMVLHELSHACASLAYGGAFMEAGLMVSSFLPGAYVLIDEGMVKSRFKRTQINAAGVEMNLFLCGFFLFLLRVPFLPSQVLIYAAMVNLILAVMNLSLIEGLDGTRIFTELLGAEEFVSRAREIVKSRRRRMRLRQKGWNGRITVSACYIIVAMQVLLPVILALNLIVLTGWFRG